MARKVSPGVRPDGTLAHEHHATTKVPPQPQAFLTGLLAAYLAAHYRVTGAAVPFVLRVGHRSAELAALHVANGVDCSAFLTAWNPGSVVRPQATNRASQSCLESELAAAGVICLAGIGEDPTGVWPGEPSVLALGISRGDAERIGRKFGQRALIWIGESANPELVEL